MGHQYRLLMGALALEEAVRPQLTSSKPLCRRKVIQVALGQEDRDQGQEARDKAAPLYIPQEAALIPLQLHRQRTWLKLGQSALHNMTP